MDKNLKENQMHNHRASTLGAKVFPEKKANPLSLLSFSWMNDFVSKGQKNRLLKDDLYNIPKEQESRNVGSRFIEIWNREKTLEDRKTQWGLHKSIFIFSRTSILISGFLDFVKMIAGLLSPFILQQFLDTYQVYQDKDRKDQLGEYGIHLLVMYCFAMCFTQLISAFAGNWSIWILVKSGLNVRTGLMSAIYDRSLNLSGIEKKNYSIGRATKMMSSDVLRVEIYWGFLHFFWTCPLQVILAFCFLYRMFGTSVFAGAAVIVASLPFQIYLLRRMSRQRPKINEVADKRIRLLQEILAGIRVIKLYSWDEIFRNKMAKLREQELKEIRKMRLSSALITTLTLALPVLASVATFICYARIPGNKLTPEIVFPAITFFGRMETPLIIIPIIASYTVDAREAMVRIGKFLRARTSTHCQKQVDSKENAVIVKAKFIWELPEGEEDGDQMIFDFDITIPKGSLVAIVGPVGSGKSSFLGAINGEMKKISGDVGVCGKIGYCPQQAWIRNCSVRDNIIFDQPFDEERYKAVIEQCALESDLANFPHGDETELGEKGISLSGGQKQRISLARMVYFNPDIAIMDDPLSAVDSQVGSTLFYDCILDGLLKDKTRILVTNQLNILAYVDQIVVLDEGRVIERGTYQELLSKDTDFSDLLKKYSNDESEDEALSESDSESESDDDSQKLLTKKKEKSAKIHSEEKREGVSAKVYWAYAAACGGLSFLLLASSFMFFTEFSRILRSFVLRNWATSTDSNFNDYVFRYGGLAGLQALSACANTVMFVWGGYRAAKVIHEGALSRIIRSPMAFFDSTPVGRILTRFSKDLDVVDSYVAEEFNALIVTFSVIFSSILLIVIVNYQMCVVLIIPLAIGYFLQSTFRTISRQIQRLNAQNFSPLMSHFSETFAGLGSIRAFQVQDRFFSKHHELVDIANRAPLVNLAMRRWVGVRSEVMGASLIFALSILSLVFGIKCDLTGMLIADTLNVIEYLDWCIKQFAETEMSLMAVERVNHYATNLEIEAANIIESNRPDPSWPAKGHIEIKDLVVQYKPSLPPVIKGISLEIHAGEHVAIVGRTGAGKTSIISSLFRLLEPASGSITIDDIDISTIGLSDLRSKIAIVPQEPALFSGTLRFNLDPFNQYSDDEIWLALERTSMKEVAMDLPDRLDGEVQECGQNFSIGQRQLLCLTRALLLRSSIIVMDEATANIDLETDEQIQISLRENFKNNTLITIAHRINTIIDYDRIIVMDSGRVAEFETPRALLSDENSIFYALASEAGVSLED
jgi:ATP-binding cassette, subfamily C (CFTR/MRP), member 1